MIARQRSKHSATPPQIIAQYVGQRTAAGQNRAEALDEVLTVVRNIVADALATQADGEDSWGAVLRVLGRQDVRTAAATPAATTDPDGTVG